MVAWPFPVCLQDSVLAFWSHGMQGRSLDTNEVRGTWESTRSRDGPVYAPRTGPWGRDPLRKAGGGDGDPEAQRPYPEPRSQPEGLVAPAPAVLSLQEGKAETPVLWPPHVKS